MTNKELLKELLEKSISRQRFLGMVGMSILGVVGLNNFIENLDVHHIDPVHKKTSKRFGNGRFGV